MTGRSISLAVSIVALLGFPRGARGAGAELRLDPVDGVILETPHGALRLDRSPALPAPVLRFTARGIERRLERPAAERAGEKVLRLSYIIDLPPGDGGLPAALEVRVEREISIAEDRAGTALTENFKLIPSSAIEEDLEVVRPFEWRPASATGGAGGHSPGLAAVWPRKDGWAKREPLGETPAGGEYRLGNFLGGRETPRLALPLVSVSSPGASLALYADPTFSALLELAAPAPAAGAEPGVRGSLRFSYRGSRVPIGEEHRTFAAWLGPAPAGGEDFRRSVDRFFDLLLPDVPPGPSWVHDVAMVGYDFLSDGGEGWERDARRLAEWLAPGERRRVALCLHGWYDALGAYSFDAAAGRIKEEWIAFERTRKVKFTREELSRRLRLARDLGFRVLLYFGDGLAADSGVSGYRDDWAYRDAKGNRISGWQGPDTFGPTYLRNPAHPEVRRFYLDYLRALLAAFGGDLDGLVWDETFHVREGQIASRPQPAYCDRAYLRLVGDLRKAVKEFDREKVFLASDCSGVFGMDDVPGYALVADGTYQDTHCDPAAWSWGLFASWRNALWSCNWDAVSGFQLTRFGVERFGVPVAISNGWGDDRGPSEWSPRERDRILRLFRERLSMADRVRCLEEDPAGLLAGAPDRSADGDPIPEPAPGEANWALASRGARASSSSEEGGGRFPPAGAIDGVRDSGGWGAGHGWASRGGEPLPQWIAVDFAAPREVRMFVVITYQGDKAGDTARRWGLTDYRIEVPGGSPGSWTAIVREDRGRAVKTRVHVLPSPLRLERFRLVADDVTPLDGQARVLQVEAWGR
jgi:F5/8 type C domain-containing protein